VSRCRLRLRLPPGPLCAAAIAGLAVWSSLAAPAPSAEEKYNRPARDWYQGPVRYLLSRAEEKQYRGLPTDAERARFIDDFWARRDEDPATPANEFEIRFWNRVAEADRSFHDAPFPGWKTDRGKILVLLGPADEVRQGMSTGLGPRGRETPFAIWIYHQPRFEGMDRETQIRFLRDNSGEMRMTDRLFASRIERLSGAARSLSFQAGLAQKVPEPKQLLDAIAASRPAMDAGRFRTHYDFFLAADGSTSVLLTLGIRPAAPGSAGGVDPQAPAGAWRVYARLANESAGYDLGDPASFRTSELGKDVDGFELFQARISVPPGFYAVFFGIHDPATGSLFSLGDRVRVPDFAADEFSLSSVTLAARLEPASHPGADDPFVVGRMIVVPKMDPVFKSGGVLAYYFQVYHPGSDPASGQARLDLAYQFFRAAALRKTGDPEFSPLGQPVLFENQSGQVHGYSFPLSGWPAGDFKVRVRARDRIADKTAEAETFFSVR
jgi:GWxTD domain-containing protein